MGCPLLSLIALHVTGLAFIVTFVGLRSTTWEEGTYMGENYEEGLFTKTFPEPWRKATGALIILGFLLGVACVVAVSFYIKYIDNDKYEILQLLGMVCAFVAGVFVLVAVIVFGAERDKVLNMVPLVIGYSFVMAAVGGGLFVVAGIILAVETCKIRNGNKVIVLESC